VTNLRVLCKSHNALHAEDDFGAAFIGTKIAQSRAIKEASRAAKTVDVHSAVGHSTGGGDSSDDECGDSG